MANATGEAAASRRATALAAARALIDALEIQNLPIDQTLMIAQRLARVMRDADAQKWLTWETRGYPSDATSDDIGTCRKYWMRSYPDGKILVDSLPSLEAKKAGADAHLQKLQAPAIAAPAENFLVAGATAQVIQTMNSYIAVARDAYVNTRRTFVAQREPLHRYAADTLIALELGEVAADIFEGARGSVDTFIRAYVPEAAEQLLAVNERMREGTAEGLAQALTSCRRLIAKVADAVFPPRDEPHVDANGTSRKVGSEQYKNRLIAFVEERIESATTAAIVSSNVEHLATRLDAVYDKANKGVHADVTEEEARLVVIQTYLFVAEIARYAGAARS